MYVCVYIYVYTYIYTFQAYAPTSNAEEAEVEWFYEDLQDLFFFFIVCQKLHR